MKERGRGVPGSQRKSGTGGRRLAGSGLCGLGAPMLGGSFDGSESLMTRCIFLTDHVGSTVEDG